MRKTFLTFNSLLILFIVFSNQVCKSTNNKKVEKTAVKPSEKVVEKTIEDFSQVEVLVSDFSKKISGYLPDMKVPSSFNEADYEKLLKDNYPDKNKLKTVFNNYKVIAKALNDRYFTVALCSKDGAHKKIEDYNCTLSRVDYRYWDKSENQQPPCNFEADWKSICH
jgi:hypothetical protein